MSMIPLRSDANLTPHFGFAGYVLVFAVLAGSFSEGNLLAQTAPPKPALSNRYLFIVETSRSMQRRETGIYKAVQDLLLTGMGGQLRWGDTLGIWTFNADLHNADPHAAQFPLQQWSPDDARGIARRVITFLHEQKFEKSARLDKVIPVMNRVIGSSDFITVILIASGSENIHGTAFDDKINTLYKSWRAEQDKAAMPIITVLRAKSGKLTDFSVNPTPWPVELPPLPAALLAAEVETPKPAPPPKQEARPPLPPIIIVGKKPELTQQSTPPEPSASQPASVAVSPAVQISDTQTARTPTPTPTTSTEPKETESAQTAEPEASSKSPLPAPASISEQPMVGSVPSLSPKPTEPPDVPKPATLAVIAPAPGDLQAGGGVVLPGTGSLQLAAVTAVAATGSPAPNLLTAIGNAQPKTPPTQVAIATLHKGVFGLAGMLLAGLALLLVVLAVWYLLARRSRASAHASLITRSMDHEKK
jgi:hypothetical protein